MMTISSTKLKMLKRCQLADALIWSHLLEKSLMENVIFVECQYLKVNNKYVKDYHPSTESS